MHLCRSHSFPISRSWKRRCYGTARYHVPFIPRHDLLRGRAHPRTDPPCAISEPSYQDLTWGTSVDGPVHILSSIHLPTGGAIGTGAGRLFGKAAFRGVVRGGESVNPNGATSAVAHKLVRGANSPKLVRSHGSIPRMTGVEDHEDLLKVAGERWLGREKNVFCKGNISFGTLQAILKDSNGDLEYDQVKVTLCDWGFAGPLWILRKLVCAFCLLFSRDSPAIYCLSSCVDAVLLSVVLTKCQFDS